MPKRKELSSSQLQKLPASGDRLGWHYHYVQKFNKTGSKQAEQLASWYLYLYLFSDEVERLRFDWKLFKEQKEYLWKLINNKARKPEGTEHLMGILHILDALEDAQESIQ